MRRRVINVVLLAKDSLVGGVLPGNVRSSSYIAGAAIRRAGTLASTALLGRDEVFRELTAALARTAGGAGDCLVVEGTAGIGKSRMLESLAAQASTVDVRCRPSAS